MTSINAPATTTQTPTQERVSFLSRCKQRYIDVSPAARYTIASVLLTWVLRPRLIPRLLLRRPPPPPNPFENGRIRLGALADRITVAYASYIALNLASTKLTGVPCLPNQLGIPKPFRDEAFYFGGVILSHEYTSYDEYGDRADRWVEEEDVDAWFWQFQGKPGKWKDDEDDEEDDDGQKEG